MGYKITETTAEHTDELLCGNCGDTINRQIRGNFLDIECDECGEPLDEDNIYCIKHEYLNSNKEKRIEYLHFCEECVEKLKNGKIEMD